MKTEITNMDKFFKKITGDIETDFYLILDFLKKENLLTEEDWTYSEYSKSKLYIYLCSLIEEKINNSDDSSEFLSDEESEFVQNIEDILEYLEL
jgi:hypothetical protein